MVNIEYLIPIVCFWHTISTEIVKHTPPALTNNIVSFIHCLLFLGSYNYDYNLDYAIHVSIGFYIYDAFYLYLCIVRNNDTFKKHAPFILHHIAGIYILNSTLSSNESYASIRSAYNILEKSNIMLYITYHVHKQYAEYVYLNMAASFIQLLTYSYFRLVELSSFIYINRLHFREIHFITQGLIIGIYCMGFAWSYRLLQKNMANYYTFVARSKKYSSAG